MAFLVLVLDVPNKTIEQLNAEYTKSVSADVGINNCADLLSGIVARSPGANVQVTSRNTDPAVSTSGVNSAQVLYANK